MIRSAMIRTVRLSDTRVLKRGMAKGKKVAITAMNLLTKDLAVALAELLRK
jgi:hypothetical protein